MSAIDSQGMTLAYKVKGQDAKKSVKVAFDPPLAGYEEVKPRLLKMTADAQESLGMTKSPQISDFELTSTFLYAAIPLSILTYSTLAPYYPADPAFSIGNMLYKGLGGYPSYCVFWGIVGLLHGLEALYTVRLASKHRMGFWVGLQYVTGVVLFGAGVLVPLRKKIQKARIDSIMKGN